MVTRKKGLSYAKSNDDMSSKLATLGAKLQSMPDFDEFELTEAEKADKLPIQELSDAFKSFQDYDRHIDEEDKTVFNTGQEGGGSQKLFTGMRFSVTEKCHSTGCSYV